MKRNIYFIGFSGYPDFPHTNILSRFYSASDTVVDSIDNANVLIIGNFVNLFELKSILNFGGIRVLYIGEPITSIGFAKWADYLLQKDLCHYYIGCVSNSLPRFVKYPFYVYNPIDFDAVNNYVFTADLSTKNFCTLINRHDPGLTRTPIYKFLSHIAPISCPGKLFNNCSNEELNRIGNAEWCKKFIFNICSENFISHPGYITEKLLNCVLGGAIPIYFGKFDDIDSLVFNKNRILFLDKDNTAEVAYFISNLVNNPSKLVEYYRQPIFLPTAQGAFDNMINHMKSWWDSI